MPVTQRPLANPMARHASGTRFYPASVIVAMLFCGLSFGPSMAVSSHRQNALTVLVVLHTLAVCGWLVLFLVQSLLAGQGKMALHRTLGTGSLLLAGVVVVLNYQTAIAMVRRGYDLSGDLGLRFDPLGGLWFPLLDTLLFAALFAGGWLCRRRPAAHKRLMLLTIFAGLIPAPIAHFVGHFSFIHNKLAVTLLLLTAFLAASAAHDWIASRRIHPVSLWVPIAVFAIENTSAMFWLPSRTWHTLAAWLVR